VDGYAAGSVNAVAVEGRVVVVGLIVVVVVGLIVVVVVGLIVVVVVVVAAAVEGRVVVVVVGLIVVVVVVVVEESAAFELHYLNEHDLSTAYYWRALYYEKDSYYEQIPLSSGSPVLVTNNEHTQ